MNLIPLKTAAAILSCSPRTIDRLFKEGRLHKYKVLGSVKVSEDELNDYIESIKEKNDKDVIREYLDNRNHNKKMSLV